MNVTECAVWDRTTRLFHWVNVLCVVLLIALGTAILNGSALVKADGLTADQVKPYAPATVNAEAYKAMRAFRGPVAETHVILFWVILGLIALHIAAIVAAELRHGGTLVSAMITGRKIFSRPPRDTQLP